ncbi:hypothetical protein N7448_002010 [Penicillium atrosanguineum]|uniref:Uncharacterized protein n=1 Tax=Penicillium atrosanguineum TaxID=1132637 RepID=A0A9W9HD51_9EURO|nr:uncharacterized protein N7443_005411 [Penicillium atrosanguineum]KAJ5128292.1 hypothetical protein N7526_006458 [Penicillium atrosanguineum]KAJ5144618.1 hypothetical protein N7448_002010 [Penicillium atrosanguineum]KAJ5300409.1 hypothetical protein N7443_005411 [Penicillium atrosanguineum]KAJ5311047.1 hypothetical protein N7476_006907 [Penicillium atrosanguineum]
MKLSEAWSLVTRDDDDHKPTSNVLLYGVPAIITCVIVVVAVSVCVFLHFRGRKRLLRDDPNDIPISTRRRAFAAGNNRRTMDSPYDHRPPMNDSPYVRGATSAGHEPGAASKDDYGDLYELPSYQSSQATLKHSDSDKRNLTGNDKSAEFR